MKLEAPFQLDFTLDRKAAVETEADDGRVYVQGYASDFGLDREDEMFEPGAFEEGLKAYMKNPVVLYHHKFDQPLGQVTELERRPEGLWVKAALDAPEPGTETADLVKKVATGTIRGFSVGGKFHRRKSQNGQTRIHAADILEISMTPTPVNPRTIAQVVGKAFPVEDEPTDGDEISEDQKALEERLQNVADIFTLAEELMEGKADLSAAGRRAAAKSGAALPDGSFPIFTASDLAKAIKLYGNAKDPAAAKAHIIKRAKALGLTSSLPDDWS